MYDFDLDVSKAGVLPGHSTQEVITYRGYVVSFSFCHLDW